MDTVLVVTVGGSCAPIITAIGEYKPDFVCFIASGGKRGSRKTVDDPGNPCGDHRKATCPHCGKTYPLGDPKGANIVSQAALRQDQYQVLELNDPDAFSDCHKKIWAMLRQLETDHSEARLVADFTGGTKTMAAVLASVALELGWELSLVKGTRSDLVKVRDGTEIASLVNAADVRARQQMLEARHLFNVYAYTAAEKILKQTLHKAPLSPSLQQEIRKWVTICRAFDAWDCFDHAGAQALLESYQGRFVKHWMFLKMLNGSRAGYAPVLDLVRNAERCAARGRYDDAVARLYRALELLAQTRLRDRTPALDSSNLDVDFLPESLRVSYETRRRDAVIKLALRDDYELLAALDDPLGQVYAEHCKHLLNALGHRNNSILAHGLVPIKEQQWCDMQESVCGFIEAGLGALQVKVDAPQFPQWEDPTCLS